MMQLSLKFDSNAASQPGSIKLADLASGSESEAKAAPYAIAALRIACNSASSAFTSATGPDIASRTIGPGVTVAWARGAAVGACGGFNARTAASNAAIASFASLKL